MGEAVVKRDRGALDRVRHGVSSCRVLIRPNALREPGLRC